MRDVGGRTSCEVSDPDPVRVADLRGVRGRRPGTRDRWSPPTPFGPLVDPIAGRGSQVHRPARRHRAHPTGGDVGWRGRPSGMNHRHMDNVRIGSQGRIDQLHRVGAVVFGVGLGVFGALGLVDRLEPFSTTGQPVLGLSSNGLLSMISLAPRRRRRTRAAPLPLRRPGRRGGGPRAGRGGAGRRPAHRDPGRRRPGSRPARAAARRGPGAGVAAAARLNRRAGPTGSARPRRPRWPRPWWRAAGRPRPRGRRT